MLKNKIIVVTGGAGLIGKEFIKAIVESSGTGIIADINESSGRTLEKEFSALFDASQVTFYKIDINSKESINDVIKFVHDKYNKIDAWVNNAYQRNAHYGRHFFDVEYDDFCENLNLHLAGYFLCCQQIAGYFKEQGYGNIINISSIYGVIAPRFEVYEGTEMTMPVEYSAIKSATIHLTKYMAKYFKGLNIRVNSISPGGILHDQPVSFLKKYNANCLNKGILDPSDLTGTLIYLLSDMSKFVNGQNIVVDDGFSL